MAAVSALELIGFVRRELFDGEGDLCVVFERFDQARGEVLGDESGRGACVAADMPPGYAAAIGQPIAVAGGRERATRMLCEEPDACCRNHVLFCGSSLGTH